MVVEGKITLSLCTTVNNFFLPLWRKSPTRVNVVSFLRFLECTQLHATFDRTPLDLGSARRRDLYLTTHNRHSCLRAGILCSCSFLSFSPFSPLFTFISFLSHITYSIYNTQQTNIQAPRGIRTRNPSRQSAADPCLRLLGHRGRPVKLLLYK
jgi:hypothetical protein